MGDEWVVDLRHFLDEDGKIAPLLGKANKFAEHLTKIVAMASASPTLFDLPERIRCRRRPGRKSCPGYIEADLDPQTEDIVWRCPVCDDHGIISNWKGTSWDRSGSPASTRSRKPVKRPGAEGDLDLVADFPTVSEIEEMARILSASLDPDVVERLDELGVDTEATLRYIPLGQAFRTARRSLRQSIKEVAALLNVPQRRIRAIEEGVFSDIDQKIFLAYSDHMGLGDLIESWRRQNMETANKIGIGNVIRLEGCVRQREIRGASISGRSSRRPAAEEASDVIYRLKITLRGSRPPIWRRALVPGNLSLYKLHKAIQISMGWFDSHLHQFIIHGRIYSKPDPDDFQPVIDERRHTLNGISLFEKTKFIYEYDFGDGWEHLILVEKIGPREPGVSYPVCIAGKRACPPEDVGGIYGYEEFLEATRNPDHEEHDSYLEWAGGEFDPDALDLEEINRELRKGR